MSSEAIVYFNIADIAVAVQADLPITAETFAPKITSFHTDHPGADVIRLHHHFGLPSDAMLQGGKTVYRQAPWAITTVDNHYIYDEYQGVPPDVRQTLRGVWTADHADGHLYHVDDTRWRMGGNESLTLMPTDQVLLARVLAERRGCLLHASGMALWEQGFCFIGHSSAGKSTTVTMLREHGTILCDDRIAVRQTPEGFRIYGTWSHGTVAEISPRSAPLRALCFIEQAAQNAAIPLTNRHEVLAHLLPCLVKPLATADWWENTLAVAEALINHVPAYRLQLDLSGKVVDVLQAL